jgi:hypothetical protein
MEERSHRCVSRQENCEGWERMLYRISYPAEIEQGGQVRRNGLVLMACCSALMVEVCCSTDMWVDFRQTAWCYVPKNRTLHKVNVCLQTALSMGFEVLMAVTVARTTVSWDVMLYSLVEVYNHFGGM